MDDNIIALQGLIFFFIICYLFCSAAIENQNKAYNRVFYIFIKKKSSLTFKRLLTFSNSDKLKIDKAHIGFEQFFF